jgi:DEAD/DEAH box helicase domain-containing protein
MTNPMSLFDQLRQTYLRYLDSPFDLRYEPLVAERRAMLDRDGRLYREPLIEPVPPYVSSGRTFDAAAAEILSASWPSTHISELSDFVRQGLFPASRELYSHQFDAFQAAVADRQDVVVTSGTGSGKTECFLLPITAALVQESARWGVAPSPPPFWDWWNHAAPPGSARRYHPRVVQRAHENPEYRPAAMRALIMYPLNALAEDQLIRLRVGLDGADARTWLDTHRRRNRFYFGRYTGRTPVAGERTTSKESELRQELRSIQTDADAVRQHQDVAPFFQKLNGAEMWSRWDMQDQPPDILITNYSMLNIMLMRRVEAPIFDATRAWLARDSRNLFHLVIDELHTYRGTPGAEVAYLLRVLLDRIGLDPNHDQLRIIASSASISGDTRGLDYLEAFFGRHRSRFRIIPGDQTPIDTVAAAGTQYRAHALAQLGRDLRHGVQLDTAAGAFSTAVEAPPLPNDAPAATRLGDALLHTGALDALRAACWGGSPPHTVPRQPAQIASTSLSRPIYRRGPGSRRGPRCRYRLCPPCQWRSAAAGAGACHVPERPRPLGMLGPHVRSHAGTSAAVPPRLAPLPSIAGMRLRCAGA